MLPRQEPSPAPGIAALGAASPLAFGSRVPGDFCIPAGAGAGSGPAFALHCVTA